MEKNQFAEKLVQDSLDLMEQNLNHKEAILFLKKTNEAAITTAEQSLSIVIQSVQVGNLKRALKYYGLLKYASRYIAAQQDVALDYFNKTLISMPNQ